MQSTTTRPAVSWLVALAAVLALAAPAAAATDTPDPTRRYRAPASEIIENAGIATTLPRVEATRGPAVHWWILGAAPTPLLLLGSLLIRRRRRTHFGVGQLPESLARLTSAPSAARHPAE